MRRITFFLFAGILLLACNNSATNTKDSNKDSTKLKDSTKKDTSNQDSLSSHPAQNAPY